MNNDPLEPVRAPRVGPEVQQARAVPADARKDRRRQRRATRSPRVQPQEPADNLPPPDDDETETPDGHTIDIYT
jgi:hypothetical protein